MRKNKKMKILRFRSFAGMSLPKFMCWIWKCGDDKLTTKMRSFLRIIIYLKKKCHFICVLQKTLYLCICKQKTRKDRYDYTEYIGKPGSPAYYSRRGRGTKR